MQLLTTLRPTTNQLTVLATIVANQDHPARAASEISANENLIAARNMLMKLNVIQYSANNAALTEKGQQIAKEQNITDEGGQLTDEGNKLVAAITGEQPPAEDQMGGLPPEPPMPGGEMGGGLPPMEGFSSLFKNILYG